MFLRRRPLNLLKVFLIIIVREIAGYHLYDHHTSEGWIPISRDKMPRNVQHKPFIPSDGRNRETNIGNPDTNYFNENVSINKKFTINDDKTVKPVNFLTTFEATRDIDVNKKTVEVNPSVLFDGNLRNILEKIVQLNSVLPAAPLVVYDSSKYVAVAAKSENASSVSTYNTALPTLQPEIAYDIPFIAYSNHATNKSDATAYYPRPNDYYGTRARRLRLSGHNENMELNSEKLKSNYLNSGSAKEKEEIGKGNAVNNFGTVEHHLYGGEELEQFKINDDNTININNKRGLANIISGEKDHTDNKITNNTIKVNEHKNADETKPNPSILSVNSNIHYSKDNVFPTHVEHLNEKFRKILEKYNIKDGDELGNYELSKAALYRNQEIGTYIYNRPMVKRRNGYNSLNHLPIDPVTVVWLSNYGQYVPGYNGRNNNYRNTYGYLASNNIHNNQPFGSYKVYSDTDV